MDYGKELVVRCEAVETGIEPGLVAKGDMGSMAIIGLGIAFSLCLTVAFCVAAKRG